jgi:O-antigen/teichoic acid export membrane protein
MRISHIAWNLSGLALPLAVAAATVPMLISQLGQERFGLLALAWGLIGYASALDLGIGRALTQHVGKLLGENTPDEVPNILFTASRITLIAGLSGGILIVAAGILGAANWIKNTDVGKSEIQQCIFLLAIALPAQAMSATYKGVNEAYLNFKSISILRAVLGALNFGGPFLISIYTNNLPLMIASLVVSRLAAFFVYKKLAIDCLPKNSSFKHRYSKSVARSLFGFGGWLTISSIVSPILVQADRFVIAATISASAVFVYVLPYEVVVQSLILVGAMSSVIFPGLTRLIHEKPEEWTPYFRKWLVRVAVIMALVCTVLGFALPTVLPLWIKSGLDRTSIEIGQILCVGVFANSLGSMFYALLHAQGKTRATAKLHLLELPLFIFFLFILTKNFGVVGAALAWVGRMVFDSLALAWMAKKNA